MIAGRPAAKNDLDLFTLNPGDTQLLLHHVDFPRCEYHDLDPRLEPSQLSQDGKNLVVPTQHQHVVTLDDPGIALAQRFDATADHVVDQRDQNTEHNQPHHRQKDGVRQNRTGGAIGL